MTALMVEAIHRAIDRLGAFGERMPRADLHAVLAYLSTLYTKPNAALRAGDADGMARYEAFIRVAVSGFNQLPAEAGETSYRGIWMSQEDIADLPRTHPLGGLVVDPGFASTELPWYVKDPANPTEGLRTVYYGESPVTIEVRSRTGRSSIQLMDVIQGRFHELTFLPGSTFLVRDLQITRTGSGTLVAHLVLEDVSHLRPAGGEQVSELHTRLVGEVAALRELIAGGGRAPSWASALDVAERLLTAAEAEPVPTGPTHCAQCGHRASADARFCELCGARLSTAGDGPRGGMLAIENLPAPVRDAVLAVLRRWAPTMRPMSGAEFPHLARGPPQTAGPVVVLDADPALVAELERAGLVNPVETFRAFGWVDPTVPLAADGVVVMFRERLADLDALVGRGCLAQGWFRRLRAYEQRFRIDGVLPPALDGERAAVAAALLAELHAAERTAAAQDALAGPRPCSPPSRRPTPGRWPPLTGPRSRSAPGSRGVPWWRLRRLWRRDGPRAISCSARLAGRLCSSRVPPRWPGRLRWSRACVSWCGSGARRWWRRSCGSSGVRWWPGRSRSPC